MGEKKKFREGQAEQTLDTLFFDFIDLAKELQPKVVVAENVKGLLLGNAKQYVRKIYEEFEKAGYYCQHWLLDASNMGVPQKRERVFFICLRKDLARQFLKHQDIFTVVPELNVRFKEPPIPFGLFRVGNGKRITDHAYNAWICRDISDSKLSHSKLRAGMKETDFNCHYAKKTEVLHTLVAKGKNTQISFDAPIYLSKDEWIFGGTFPSDYNFLKLNPFYLIGMSVPPVMTAQIVTEVYNQWLSKIPTK